MLKISQHAHKICRFSNDCELRENYTAFNRNRISLCLNLSFTSDIHCIIRHQDLDAGDTMKLFIPNMYIEVIQLLSACCGSEIIFHYPTAKIGVKGSHV